MKQPVDLTKYTKLNLTCGSVSPFPEPWINVGLRSNVADLEMDIRKLPQEWSGQFWEVRASHVIERCFTNEWPEVLQEWLRVLKPGGTLRLALLDLGIMDDMTLINFLDELDSIENVQHVAKRLDSAALHNINDDSQNSCMIIAGKKAGNITSFDAQEQSEFSIDAVTEIPTDKPISAVFVFAFNQMGQLLVIRNERGWDIPGGHVEVNETPEEALQREVTEEASATIANPRLFVSANAEKHMLFYVADVVELQEFTAEYETDQREFMHPTELISLYGGGKLALMTQLLNQALQLRDTGR